MRLWMRSPECHRPFQSRLSVGSFRGTIVFTPVGGVVVNGCYQSFCVKVVLCLWCNMWPLYEPVPFGRWQNDTGVPFVFVTFLLEPPYLLFIRACDDPLLVIPLAVERVTK